jgi:hypothetical protein
MCSEKSILSRLSILDAAICVGLVAVFLAISIPLIHGAHLRRQMAECARKVELAAGAFDLYAQATGEYPPNRIEPVTGDKVDGVFGVCRIDWWNEDTEMGGRWAWFSGSKDTFSVVIFNPKASESRMRKLDALLDDGDLATGLFTRCGVMYCYRLANRSA